MTTRDRRCKRGGGGGWDAGLRPGRRRRAGHGAASYGSTGRARRRRCPHRRVPTSIRGSRRTARAWRSSSATEELDIWLWDLSRATLTRVTSDPGLENYPVWTPDGRQLLFSSERAGARNLFAQAADGTGAVTRLTESPNAQFPTSVSPDGTRLVFTEIATATAAGDVLQLRLDGTHAVTPLVQTPFSERNGEVSPDGRWLAYEANDSGRFEIYVRPFPDVDEGPMAGVDGRRHAAAVGAERSRAVLSGTDGRPHARRRGSAGRRGRRPHRRSCSRDATAPPAFHSGRTYDVSPDGRRFLMIKDGAAERSERDAGQHGRRAQLDRRAEASGAEAVNVVAGFSCACADGLGCHLSNPAAE